MYQPNDDEIPDDVKDDLDEGTKSFASFLSTLEDGRFHADLSEELRKLNYTMRQNGMAHNGKVKGEISLNIKFVLDDGLFHIKTDYSVKRPKRNRPKSVAWGTRGFNFAPSNPNQLEMFAEVKREPKSVSSREIKTVS